jgi:hypothetical protein
VIELRLEIETRTLLDYSPPDITYNCICKWHSSQSSQADERELSAI